MEKKYPEGMNPEDYHLWVYLKYRRTLTQIGKKLWTKFVSGRYDMAKHKMSIWVQRGWVRYERDYRPRNDCTAVIRNEDWNKKC